LEEGDAPARLGLAAEFARDSRGVSVSGNPAIFEG